MSDDLISRQAAMDAITDESIVTNMDSVYDSELHRCKRATHRILAGLPSAQSEIKPIEYRDCANAMLTMWMDNVVTDGEYNRIMDKLNEYWRVENGRLDKQTGCD